MNKFIILVALCCLFFQCDTQPIIPAAEVSPLSAGARTPTREGIWSTEVIAQRYKASLPSPIVRTLNIPYGKSVDDKGRLQIHTLDIAQLDDDPLQARPVIVLIHGGGFRSGNKVHMADFANLYAQYGYVTVSINYRLATKAFNMSPADTNFVAAVEDTKEDAFGAIRWLRANAAQWRIDKGRIGVLGYSAGATTALSVNFDQQTQRQENDAALDQSTAISTIVELVGLTDPALINPTGKPVLMIHGVNDPGVKFHYAVEIYRICQENRVPVVLQSTPGGHNMAPYFSQVSSSTLNWFKTYLVDAQPVY